MPNPRGTRPSPFDTVRTSSRGFKKFTRSFEAAAETFSKGKPSGTSAAEAFSQFQQSFEQSLPSSISGDEEFQGLGHKVIEFVTPHGNEARLHITGFSPFQQDEFGILKAIEGVIIEEVRDMVSQEIDDEARQTSSVKPTTQAKLPDLSKFAKKSPSR